MAGLGTLTFGFVLWPFLFIWLFRILVGLLGLVSHKNHFVLLFPGYLPSCLFPCVSMLVRSRSVFFCSSESFVSVRFIFIFFVSFLILILLLYCFVPFYCRRPGGSSG